ncbi:MAG: CRISPR-associated helicase Cas3' [Candidatus Hadarchaeum sp.]|uniref:CRISPR-associated helicase Cas3' n=2 Tax=Candidatus Hadarchaeum sp. TaxID=2883567 RepID=UPI003177E385
MKETQYFEKNKAEYRKFSHKNKPLQVHCEEIVRFFKKLSDFYGIQGEVFSAMGEYLAYYHDLGKLEPEWKYDVEPKPPHAPKSYERLEKHGVVFQTRKNLTPILWYMILKHHGRLGRPEQLHGANALTSYLRNLNIKSLGVDPRDLADVFGLFKIADALSATDPKYRKSIENQAIKKPKYSSEDIKKVIGKIEEDKWKEQLKIKNLPDIALLRAPTAWGKTTVSLLYPLSRSHNRIFYLLPTITAINKFYEKLRGVFGEDVSKIFYFYDTEVKENEERLATLFFAKCFLTPIVITTVDQFLLSFLQCGRYHTKRVAFRDSSIILDEVHLLNPVMLTLLTHFVELYKEKYGLKLLLMSATLPNALQKHLKWRLKISDDAFLDFGDEYKRRKKRIRFNIYCDDIIKSVDEIPLEYENGKKILVITNTVEKAVKLRKRLQKQVGDDNVMLLHSRFMYCDRREKELKLEDLMRRPHILVATQVCEVSLDVSYDRLYTELAPLGSMIQRFGRVNRYYETIVDGYNIHIYYPRELRYGEKYYPYEKCETDDCWYTLEKLKGPSLESEWQLIEEFDRLVSYDTFEKDLEESGGKVDVGTWGEIFQNFYSFDVEEEELKEIVEYRDSFTKLILPHPEMLQNEKRKMEIVQLLEEYEKLRKKTVKISYERWIKMFAQAKELSVPVPVRWLRESNIEKKIFPIAKIPKANYNSAFGLVKIHE